MNTPEPPPIQPKSDQPVKTSGISIVGLVFGILSLCGGFLVGIPGLICSIIGLNKASKPNGGVGGKGVAIGGIVTSAVGTLFGTMVIASIAMPAYNRVTVRAIEVKEVKEVSDVSQLMIACRMYAADNDGAFPPTLDILYPDYLSESLLWNDPFSTPQSEGVPFNYQTGLTMGSDSKVPLIYSDSYGRGGDRIIGYAGGQVLVADSEAFEEFMLVE